MASEYFEDLEYYSPDDFLETTSITEDIAWNNYLQSIQKEGYKYGINNPQTAQQIFEHKGTIGIFWIYKGKVCGNHLTLKHAKQDVDFLVYPGLHAVEYQQILPEEIGDWGDIPRGRIIYHIESGRFKVASSKGIISSYQARNMLLKYFHISKSLADWGVDEQYVIEAELDYKN